MIFDMCFMCCTFIVKVNHEFVNLLKIGRRVGQKKIGDIEGLFDNRVKTNDDEFILHCIFFKCNVSYNREIFDNRPYYRVTTNDDEFISHCYVCPTSEIVDNMVTTIW